MNFYSHFYSQFLIEKAGCLLKIIWQFYAAFMKEIKAVYVQGCARSGNTLMRELCVSGFLGTQLVKVSRKNAECSFSYLIELLRRKSSPFSRLSRTVFLLWRKPLQWLIASRDHDASLAMDLELLRANPAIKVIWMLRNPLDILTSVHDKRPDQFYVKPERLLKSLQLYHQFKNEAQVLTVRYEELVSNPNTVQAVIAKTFLLEPVCAFTESHKNFPRFKENIEAMHSIRPVDAGSVQKWKTNPGYRDYLKKVLTEHPELISIGRDLGYEMNLD